ncbi:MAG: RecQ family ATP-dependent DNA helicase [bacterium]|nr:RecQ family ATP-dependent DNA helicase [bacterium]
MGVLPDFVVFDLETNADSPDRTQHQIIQIGAVRAGPEGVVDRFETLVRPTRKVADHITELTGLEDADLARAPKLREALGDFFAWLRAQNVDSPLPLIAHNGFGYDFVVLDAAADAVGVRIPDGPRLDSLEPAHLVYARAGAEIKGADSRVPPPGRSVDDLAKRYGLIDLDRERHDALEDSELTYKIVMRLLEKLSAPTAARQLQCRILGQAGHPWAEFVPVPDHRPELHSVVPTPPPDPPVRDLTGRLDADQVVGKFREGGALMTDGRTPRPQQIEMAGQVIKALNQPDSRTLIEAPTGTGKTLAYLVPAIEIAQASGRKALITPHTRVLQDQILGSLEDLESVLPPFRKVVVKGKQNYLSLNALEAELISWSEEDQTGPDQQKVGMALAILCGWVAETPSGDWADLRTAALDSRLEALRFFRWKLRVEFPPGPSRTELDELDFYRRARQGLKEADVAVLNHALLATDPGLGSDFNLIIDEAHDLEDSATAAATKATGSQQVAWICRAIWDERSRRGLVARLASATGFGLADEKLTEIRSQTQRFETAIRQFGEQLVEYVRDRTGTLQEDAARYGTSYRIRRGVDTGNPRYQPVIEACHNLKHRRGKLVDALDDFTLPDQLQGRYRRDDLEDELYRLNRDLSHTVQLIDAVVWAAEQLALFDEEEDFAEMSDWINIAEISYQVRPTRTPSGDDEPPPNGTWEWGMRRVPLSVTGMLAGLWLQSHATILTSATLRSGDSFDYLIKRLGVGDAQTKLLDSPFERLSEQHLLILTDYLPAPRGSLMDRFTEVESGEIPRLCVVAGGGAMALMTARIRLEHVRDHARPHLTKLGLKLLAQGDSSSRALVEQMKREPSSSLLGLRSFWEGVDIPGEALRLLIIEKVPFDAMGDPVPAARMDLIERQGEDPFARYMVPRAAIAFAQGVGRLIRTAEDRGVTVVLDNRLRRPVAYRDVLLDHLSGPPQKVHGNSPDQTYQEIARHLGIQFNEELRQRVEQIPAPTRLSSGTLQVDSDVELTDEVIAEHLETAREWLGFKEWRPFQQEIMKSFIRGEDVVAVLPTGSGKSVTFQVPALLSPGVTLVISPLVALMRDQVDNLRAQGISEAAAIYSGIGQAEQRDILRAAAAGHIKLLYVSPERLWSPAFRSWLSKVDVQRIAIDEAHCISMWGHSFRPEYALIPEAVAEATSSRRLPTLAATATATPRVLEDVGRLLELPDPTIMVGSANRPEIRYYVELCTKLSDRDLRVVQVLEAFRRRSAIVYVPTRNDTGRLASLLRMYGHRVRPYNGAMESNERGHTEDAFRHGEIDVVVATKAFGLGIDKPDIALIVHLEMPASIEEYLQETGRAARGANDGTGPEYGTAVLMVTPNDCRIHKHFVKNAVPDEAEIHSAFNELEAGLNYIDPWEGTESNFGSGGFYGEKDHTRSLALHYLHRVGAVRRQPDFVMRGRVNITSDTWERFDNYRRSNPLNGQAERILRYAEEVGGDYGWSSWRHALGLSPVEIERVLFELQREDICDFTAWRFGWVFEKTEEADLDGLALRSLLEGQQEITARRADQARALAHSRPSCRRREMLLYLDDSQVDFNRCGGCDACTPDLPRPWQDSHITQDQIRQVVEEEADKTILILVDSVEGGQYSRNNLVRTLRGLATQGPYSLPDRLRLNQCFEQLSMMKADQVEERIAQLIADGTLESVCPEGRSYETLRLTEEGRTLVKGRYTR